MKYPPLKAMATFETVARLNSFSQAADELHISQSAVSHQIRLLEDFLGETLFRRLGRYLELSDVGYAYYEAIAPALAQIQRATVEVQGQETLSVRLALFSSFAVRWLIPRLPDLQRQHPTLDLALEMMNEAPQLTDRVADCFITLLPDSRGFTTEALYTEQLFAVCSRTLWQRMQDDWAQFDWSDDAQGISPHILQHYPLLSVHSIYGQRSEDWRRWFAAAGETLPEQARLQHFSHMLLALEAARHHQGIVLTNDYMFQPAQDTDLVKLPFHALITGDVFHFACKTHRQHEPGIAMLRHWLRAQAKVAGWIM
ncbi:LysR substrate-binding domain-containing protein [Salinispirillum marinum]|uniref:LysR substrate-binding domain-containing protein n=2 Tax=Saccharospirillaceae TaxID=255527 RepID=A0ABV8BEJ4_9GAMM